MPKLKLLSTGDNHQITVQGLAQITLTDEGAHIDLAGDSIQAIQNGSRITLRLHPRLAFVAPEARAEVARELYLTNLLQTTEEL